MREVHSFAAVVASSSHTRLSQLTDGDDDTRYASIAHTTPPLQLPVWCVGVAALLLRLDHLSGSTQRPSRPRRSIPRAVRFQLEGGVSPFWPWLRRLRRQTSTQSDIGNRTDMGRPEIGGPWVLAGCPPIGFCIWRVVFDLMHTLDLGILQVILPAIMFQLCNRRNTTFRGRKQQERFTDAYKKYRQSVL